MLADGFKKYNYAEIIFDPIPSYNGVWYFNVENLYKLSKKQDSKNLFESFINKVYFEPLKKIFNTNYILSFEINMVSMSNENKIGRCLKFSKYTFFENLLLFFDSKLDRVGRTKEDHEKYLVDLYNTVFLDNESTNIAFANALKDKENKLSELKQEQINSKYFEAAMEDYELVDNKVSFEEYVDDLYNTAMSLQKGMIKLNDFFDYKIDYNAMYETFDADVFFLLFAKIIYEFNLVHDDFDTVNNNISYLYHFSKAVSQSKEIDTNYDPVIRYIYPLGNYENVSMLNLQSDCDILLKKYSEVKLNMIGEIREYSDNYKNILLMEKILDIKNYCNDKWEFISANDSITRNDNNKLRIDILEKSDYIFSPLKGLNNYDGYYAFIYANGKVVLENINIDVKSNTYVINIDDFFNMIMQKGLTIKEYLNTLPVDSLKRIFYTSINNWQRNIYSEINGIYNYEDAINFINTLNTNIESSEEFFYSKLLNYIYEERETFDTLVSTDNVLGLNVSSEDIISYLEFSKNDKFLKSPIIGNIIITEGDILSILRLINDITTYNGEYIIHINEDNTGTITYLISRANKIYKELNIGVNLKIDYNEN